MKKAAFAALFVLIFAIPVFSYADSVTNTGTFTGLGNLDTVGGGQGLVPQHAQGSDYTLCDLRTLANNIITYAVILSVFVATLMFAYGGVLYVTAPAAGEGQLKKAHGVLTSVFVGIVIVLLAWLIVNIVLSVLTGGDLNSWTNWFGGSQCQNPIGTPFSQVPGTGTGTGQTTGGGTPTNLATGTLSNNDALTQLHNAGVCGDQYSCLKAGASLQGIRQSTVDGLVQLHEACGCQFTVTSGTDGSHAGGGYSHANGYKVDIRTSDNGTLTSWVQSNFSGPVSVVWGGVPSQQYTDNCGNKYTNEGDHWDVGYTQGCIYSGGGG